jgi:hypothetical protein
LSRAHFDTLNFVMAGLVPAISFGKESWLGDSRSKNGVALLAYVRSKNGVALLAYVPAIHDFLDVSL